MAGVMVMETVIGQIVLTVIALPVFGETHVIGITPGITTKSVASSSIAMMPATGALMAADRAAPASATSFGVTASVIARTLLMFGAIAIGATSVEFT